MGRILSGSTGLFVLISLVISGCDMPPEPPKTADGKIARVVAVSPNNTAELDAVTAMETARVNYMFRLKVLRDYYLKIGNLDKHRWSEREIKNLNATRVFEWDNMPKIVPPAAESLEGADERLLAEYAVSARNQYNKNLEALAGFYEREDLQFKAKLIGNMQKRFDPVRTYMYFLDAEIPGPDYKPTKVISEADELYTKAYRLYMFGKPLPGVTDYQKQREALMLFLELVNKYPDSTKSAMSAYYIAEIYKEYFNENVRAVHWYQRAWQWAPNISEAARFQAATIYDIRLHNYTKALECYKLSLEQDPPRLGNAATARRRIGELSGQ